MRNFLSKMGKGYLAGTLVLAFVTSSFAANFILRHTVAGTEMDRLDANGSYSIAGVFQSSNTAIIGGPIKQGNSGLGSGVTLPTTTTGSNFGDWVPVFNVGAAVTQGDVLMSSNTGTAYVAVCTATSGLKTIVGVAAESIASGANGWMVPLGGKYAIVHATNTVTYGDILVTTSAAAGYLATNNSPTAGTEVAKALSTNAVNTGGNVLAIMQ